MPNLDSNLLTGLDLHPNIDIGVLPPADLDDGQCRFEVGVEGPDVRDLLPQGLPDLRRGILAREYRR